MLPAGRYYSQQFVGGTMDTMGEKATPLMRLTFAINHIASGDKWDAMTPENRDVQVWLSTAAWPYSRLKLAALGFNGDFANPEFNAEAVNGVELVCEHETYDGKDRERWSLADWGAREPKPPSADVVRLLSARWKTAASAEQAPAGRPAPPPVQTEPVDESDYAPPPGGDEPF